MFAQILFIFCVFTQKLERLHYTLMPLVLKYLCTCRLLCVLSFASLQRCGTVTWQKCSSKFRDSESGRTACCDRYCSVREADVANVYIHTYIHTYIQIFSDKEGWSGSVCVEVKLRAGQRNVPGSISRRCKRFIFSRHRH